MTSATRSLSRDGWLGLNPTGSFLAAGVTINERMRARFLAARACVEWAGMLLRRGKPGDRERARELLHTALETSRERGFGVIERVAEPLVADLS